MNDLQNDNAYNNVNSSSVKYWPQLLYTLNVYRVERNSNYAPYSLSKVKISMSEWIKAKLIN